jgi:hypothetical protein
VPDAEELRLEEDRLRTHNWKRWGPYLAERQWGTVREDYSPDGEAWKHFPFEHSRSRAYRWGEDGLLGWCDRQCRLCFAPALWNGHDPILKERLFGLANHEGNHGEDVKECYHYLRSSPTHSYASALYKYPQAAFPYDQLRAANRARGYGDPEFELADTGVFDGGRTFDLTVEYAKRSPEDTLIRLTATNAGPDAAPLHLLPTFWFRNTWSWDCTHEGCELKPSLTLEPDGTLISRHRTLGTHRITLQAPPGTLRRWLFAENETNTERLYGQPNTSPHPKDAFHDAVVHGRADAVHASRGTKAAPWIVLNLAPGASAEVWIRLAAEDEAAALPGFEGAAELLTLRRDECEAHTALRLPAGCTPEEAEVIRQARAGLLWSKQFYHYVVDAWLRGDPGQPPPPPGHASVRNQDWDHFFARDVLSMPDTWEYPWFAAWDLAFHMVPFAEIDPDFAKNQLLLLLREWYLHPNGQIPAYEWNFADVNPPVHAWAVWRVYKITGARGCRDTRFLERAFLKLLLNFNWWVNRKDPSGRHIFSGGFLGLDNIGVFDRSKPLPGGGHLEQADGTAWMGFYCLTMLSIALELAQTRPAYEDIASKFFEHFVAICDAMNTLGGYGLWDDTDGFYYDILRIDGHHPQPMRIRSMVGLLPLCAVEILQEDHIDCLPGFRTRLDWFLEHNAELARHITRSPHPGRHDLLLSLPSRNKLLRLLPRVFDEAEFLSPHGIRSLSKAHERAPFIFRHDGYEACVAYLPGESDSWLFGGNSNWRGPVWFPVNYLLIEALERYHHFYGDTLQIEFPTGSGDTIPLDQAAARIGDRLASLFLPGPGGRRPCHGADPRYATDPRWRDLLLFHEYFHGDTGKGLGANHQTGWTALVTRLIRRR